MASETSFSNRKIAAIAVSSTLFILSLSGLAILKTNLIDEAAAGQLRQSRTMAEAFPLTFANVGPTSAEEDAKPYYIFLQKFPLQHTFKSIFHTEVILCPKEELDSEFATTLDGILATLEPSRFTKTADEANSSLTSSEKEPFAEITEDKWKTQTSPSCIQLGYAGSQCNTPCCSVPHTAKNVAYALNSRTAVISNAMGDHKQLYLYGKAEMKDGVDAAFPSVCHGHYGAIEEGTLPKCVSNWAGTDYNPITNNCNTFTSTVLKYVFGLTDAKPSLWVSDLMSVTCPSEKGDDGSDVERCVVPSGAVQSFEVEDVSLESE